LLWLLQSSIVWALQILLYQEQFLEPDETGVLTHILEPKLVKDEQSASIFLQLLTQLHSVLAAQELSNWIIEQVAELVQPYPFVTQVGWKALQRVSVLNELEASVHFFGVHVPEAAILPAAVVLQGPSVAVNLLHYSRVPVKSEQALG